MRICVVALGKIGLPLAVQYASKGHEVVGYDVSERVVQLVNDGIAPFPGEAGLDALLKEVVADGRLTATTDGVARGCDFLVRLNGATGQSYDVPLNFGVNAVAPAPAVVTPGFAVVSHTVDPDGRCLVWEAPGTGVLIDWPRADVDPWRAR